MMNKLIIFAKTPALGMVKTRLIPEVGAEKALEIHKLLFQKTVRTADKLKSLMKYQLEIAYDGDQLDELQAALNIKAELVKQTAGKLGERMLNSFQNSLNFEGTILIGIDCPEMEAEIISKAFEELKTNDIVLGPAKDGGYYLIGLKSVYSDLFSGIEWGSNSVLEITLGKVQALKLKYFLLPELNDIDRPEDLKILCKLGML